MSEYVGTTSRQLEGEFIKGPNGKGAAVISGAGNSIKNHDAKFLGYMAKFPNKTETTISRTHKE